MNKYLELVNKYLGEKLAILDDVFASLTGEPPLVSISRYRANHAGWMDQLDALESDQLFLARYKDSTSYRIRVFALPVLRAPRAALLMSAMNTIYAEFREIYQHQLSEHVKTDELLELAKSKLKIEDTSLAKEALWYMVDSHAVWAGVSTDFPYAPNTSIGIAEAVLRHKSFDSVLAQVYEWHILNPRKRAALAAKMKRRFSGEPGKRRARTIPSKTRRPLRGETTELPAWYAHLPVTQKALIYEIEKALQYELAALPTMGLRTLLEVIMKERLGVDKGTFKANVEAFMEAGFITKQLAGVIESVIDAGHAAVHRAYFPNASDLKTCVEAVRHLMEHIYILKPKIDAVASNTPKRDK